METIQLLETQLKLLIESKLAFHLTEGNSNEYEILVGDIEAIKSKIRALKLKFGILE